MRRLVIDYAPKGSPEGIVNMPSGIVQISSGIDEIAIGIGNFPKIALFDRKRGCPISRVA
ncbi:hypothetical protein B1A99_11590 [Cohnella sp. CIP 111063]|nr:hypothetical protein B1A99_11590 [Cohnella sp. CIP 111063]